MTSEIVRRLQLLRDAMRSAGINAVIIPQADPHQSEYIADHWQIRRYLSGFTGSAGDLVVTLDDAALWTDSRYFIQAAAQLDGSGIQLMKDLIPGTPSITQWLCSVLDAGATVGIDGIMFAHRRVEALTEALGHNGLKLVTDFDPIDALWPDRPTLPKGAVFSHDMKYAGESAADKIAKLLTAAASQEADALLLNALDEIAWTLNIRCNDVNCNPVAISYLYLSPDGSRLFIDPEKVNDDIRAELAKAGVDIAPYDAVFTFFENLTGRRVLADSARLTQRLWESMRHCLVEGVSVVAMLKACKNDVQLDGMRAAMQRDGVALVRAFMEIEQRLADNIRTTEIDVADILERHRSAMPLYFDISFETISGYGPHGAIVHYSATPETDVELPPHGLLLVDSGAQYLDGTTDITRTIALGAPTEQERTDFTLVMQGHIALARAIYPAGTRGSQLDVLARMPLWQHGLSYLHGTGHGVGQFLNVHEGPQGIRLNDLPATLEPGMITSNEPGLYREGLHGVRCENLVLTTEAFTTDFGTFYRFETITLYPFDRSLFDLSMMSRDEIQWVDDYHREVYRRLSPDLTDTERAWLREKTLPLEQ